MIVPAPTITGGCNHRVAGSFGEFRQFTAEDQCHASSGNANHGNARRHRPGERLFHRLQWGFPKATPWCWLTHTRRHSKRAPIPPSSKRFGRLEPRRICRPLSAYSSTCFLLVLDRRWIIQSLSPVEYLPSQTTAYQLKSGAPEGARLQLSDNGAGARKQSTHDRSRPDNHGGCNHRVAGALGELRQLATKNQRHATAAMPTTEIPAATGPVSDCCTVCNGVSQGKPVVLVEAKASAFETSAKPAIVKNRLLLTRSAQPSGHSSASSSPMLISFFPVECPCRAATGNA